MKLKTALFCGIAAASLSATGAQAATINLIDLGGVTGSPAEQGFKAAAFYWETMLTNNATINLGVRFAPLAPNVIGSTGSTRSDVTVQNWKNAVQSTRSGYGLDQTAVLPTLTNGGASFITNGARPDGNNDTAIQEYVDGDTTSSQVLYLNTSVQKALGIYAGAANALDGTVTFSSNFNFDFAPGTNNVSPNTFDFLGVAIHEIGHALGFVSGVDFLDVYGYPNGPGAGALGYNLNDTSIFSAIDMFRYSTDPNGLAPGGGPSLDLTVGTASYFSIDGGQTALWGGNFSTGRYNGDGRQASHFKDHASCTGQLGIMDPTFCFGTEGEITALDLAAFDAMGWNLRFDVLNNPNYNIFTRSILAQYLSGAVPEPATWAMMIAGFGFVGSAMRRRNRTTKVTFA